MFSLIKSYIPKSPSLTKKQNGYNFCLSAINVQIWKTTIKISEDGNSGKVDIKVPDTRLASTLSTSNFYHYHWLSAFRQSCRPG